MQCADVGMIQRGDGARFPLEALRELILGNFQGNDAIQPRVASPLYLPHAARTDQGENLVRAEPGSRVHRFTPVCQLSTIVTGGSALRSPLAAERTTNR